MKGLVPRREANGRKQRDSTDADRISAYLYVMEGPNGVIKVGFSSLPARRATTLTRKSGVKVAVAWLGKTWRVNAHAIEQATHRRIAHHRVIGEWYILDTETAVSVILNEASRLGVELEVGDELPSNYPRHETRRLLTAP